MLVLVAEKDAARFFRGGTAQWAVEMRSSAVHLWFLYSLCRFESASRWATVAGAGIVLLGYSGKHKALGQVNPAADAHIGPNRRQSLRGCN